jgi:ferrochelatase
MSHKTETQSSDSPLSLLLVSYGAPERKEDVVPFLTKLFAGKKVSPERLNAVTEKYYDFARQTGSFSPLNEECRSLIAGMLWEFNQDKIDINVYWGNLFWHPLLEETIAEMTRDGIKHAVYFTTSAFDSYVSNKRYTDILEAARQKIGSTAPILEKLPLPFDHSLFLEAQTDRLLDALAWFQLDDSSSDEPINNVIVLFSAHSIPKSDAKISTYSSQLTQTCRSVIEKCGTPDLPWGLVYQSRSGSAENWLGPDIKDRIREIAKTGQYRSVIVSPIGFFCENMETANDLDLEVGELCAELGLGFVRARAVGASPKICRMIREIVIGGNRGE